MSISAKTPKFRYKDCRHQLVEHPIQSRIPDAEKPLIDNMLLEKIPLAWITRVTGLSQRSTGFQSSQKNFIVLEYTRKYIGVIFYFIHHYNEPRRNGHEITRHAGLHSSELEE